MYCLISYKVGYASVLYFFVLRPKPYFDFFGQTLLRPKFYFDQSREVEEERSKYRKGRRYENGRSTEKDANIKVFDKILHFRGNPYFDDFLQIRDLE